MRRAGAGAAPCGDADAAVRLRGVPRGVAAGAQHGHQQARLPRLPQHHRPHPPRPIRILPREEGQAAAHPQLRCPVLLSRPMRNNGEPRVLPSGLGQHVAHIRLRHPELRPGHHLRHGRRAPDREGPAGPAGRRGEGGGHAGLRGGRVGDHALQRPHHLRVRGRQAQRDQHGGVVVGGAGRRGQELDAGLRVPDRALPVVVGVAGAAGAGAQEVPSAAVGHVLHLLLRRHPVPHHRRLHGEERRRLGLPLRLRDLYHRLRRFHRLRRGVRGADMVHRPRRSGVRGRVPARPDARRRHHGLPHPRREVLPRRDHWRRSDHHRSVPGAVGQERGEGARGQGGGGGGGGHGVNLLRRARRHPERQGLLHHPAPPPAFLHLLRQRLNEAADCTCRVMLHACKANASS